MCRIDDCERHEFTSGLCLTHLREKVQGLKTELDAAVEDLEKPTRRTRKKKVDALEVETNDDTTELETREEA